MPLREDVIAAPITGHGAVGIIRLSGPGSWRVAAALFPKWTGEPWRVRFGPLCTGDEGMACAFPEGRSYTGEESAEISLHGGSSSMSALMEAALAAGARQAEPGEFTLRAFMAGRIDLTQAEGVRETVEAASSSWLNQAHRLRRGDLKDKVHSWRSAIEGVMAAIEAAVDFEEEVGPLDRPSAAMRLEECIESIQHALESGVAARVWRDGVRIALVGRPNVGKSSLMNALLSQDRAIVTDIPGTTRDTLEETVVIGGIRCVLTDTAGIRSTEEPVERIGVSRSLAAAGEAQVVWMLYDGAAGWTDADQEAMAALAKEPDLILANKSDLGPTSGPGAPVSAVRREGFAVLQGSVSALAPAEEGLILLDRHQALLQDALESCRRAQATLANSSVPPDLATVDLQAAYRALGQATGDTAPPDVIDRIFRDFCIGK